MVIAHVITRLLRAGSEENTIGTCVGQADAGHEVLLIHGRDWNPVHAGHCSQKIQLIEVSDLVHAIDPRKDVKAVRALRALFREARPTVVHTHQSKAGIVGRYAARLSRVPVIIHGVHTVPFAAVGRVQKMVYLAAEKAVAGCTDAFINVSDGTRQTYLEHAVGRPEQHFVAHSGFDVERFRHAPWPDNWRALCGLHEAEEKPPIILMLAALEERKRHIAFIESFDRIAQRVPGVRLLLAGEGPMREAIEATIAKLGLQASVRLLGFNSLPERLIALADLTVLTSTREGLPRVIVQSLAGGKPVVTTELPGITELVANGVNGIITPGEDLRCTADTVADLLIDSDRLGRLQACANRTDVSSWDTGAMCSVIADIYQQIFTTSHKIDLH